MRMRVAIAGCHRMLQPQLAGHNFASACAALPETEMVAVYDRGAETRADFVRCWGEMPAYDDYAAMLREVQPDLLCIATRQTLHAAQIEQAAAAGVRGILCDKPLATSLIESDRIISVCREQGIALAFALDRRWHDAYRHLRRLIAEGIVGKVTSVLAFGSPNLINHGCHWYDTALMLLNDPEPLWVSGWVDDLSNEPADSRRRMDPAGRGQVGLDNGAVLSIMADGGQRPAFEVIGEAGRLLILQDAELCYLWTEGGAAGESGLRPLAIPPNPGPWPAGPAMVRDLVMAVASHSPTACDIEQARRATEIGFAIHISHMRDAARVMLPAMDRTLSIPSFPWGNE
ncbi:MAG: Gfo/Idh/MocA family oxidoreductase [Chloroflexi bacterium]|nr:Gfo/Idh/MocA family oxidoreductase [Chloroflexota bacterium]